MIRPGAAARRYLERDAAWWAWYDTYLQSDAWQTKRLAVLARDRSWCQGCRARHATQVHHISYKHVGNELLWELVAVCDECHQRAHQERGA
jgi:5-methylcytosine-specific restriction endonuclease McrA